MLYNFIEFGGVLFWIIVCLDILMILAFLDEKDSASAVLFGSSIGAFYLLSQPPELKWQWIAGYFVIGIIWFLVIFRFRIGKLKKFITKHGYNKEEKLETFLRNCAEDKNDYMYNTYNCEPSYSRFFDRVFCWPFSMLKSFFADFISGLWDFICEYLIAWKKSYLGEV